MKKYAVVDILLRSRARLLLKLDNVPYEEVQGFLSSAFLFEAKDLERARIALWELEPRMKG